MEVMGLMVCKLMLVVVVNCLSDLIMSCTNEVTNVFVSISMTVIVSALGF